MRASNRHSLLRGEAWLVAAALVLYWTMTVSVSPRVGVTADEVVHITGGYSYWKFNDYRLHPENGALPMRMAALPLLALNLQFPSLDSPAWLTSNANHVGREFLFELGNPVDRMLLAARAMIALLGVAAAWLTWRWARSLFGPAAGAVALVLAVFCPALLAHGGLVTSDMALTVALLAALSTVWLLFHRVTWWRLGSAILCCALAFLAKMSGVLLVPLIAALALVRCWFGPPLVVMLGRTRWLRSSAERALGLAALCLLLAAGSLTLLWANYGFRFEGFNRPVSEAKHYQLGWDVILDESPVPAPHDTKLDRLIAVQRPFAPSRMTELIRWMRDHRVLPEAYLWGFAHTYKFSRYRPAFFMGEYRATGWVAFFPVAFLLKTTLPALVLVVVGAFILAGAGPLRRPLRWFYRAMPWFLFFAVYWLLALNLNLNIGHRHILPTYPVFYIIASASALWLVNRASYLKAGAICGALALHAVDASLVRPFYLSYFQPLAGGMERGYRYLVDSSFDWGQGLPALRDWLREKESRGDRTPVHLCYFGADSPRARGLNVVRFGDEIGDHGMRGFPASLRGGWYVISATHYQRVYLPTRNQWTDRHEALYREIDRRLREPQTADSATAEDLRDDAKDYELLQTARLIRFVQDRPPLEIVGGSLLIFHLSEAEVAAALYGPPP